MDATGRPPESPGQRPARRAEAANGCAAWPGDDFPAFGLTWRQATRADCNLLGRLNRQLIEDEGHRNAMTELELARRMRLWLTRGGYTGLLFFEDDDMVAYALYREGPDEIYLRHLFVMRGRRRQGIGRQAMRTLREGIWPPGKRLTVEVLWTNAAAIAFWKAMGYREYSLCLEIMP